MPQVIFYHLWGDDPYDYSEGYFYTIAEKHPDVEQKKYSSSGTHVALGKREDMVKLLHQHIIERLKEDLSWKFASVGEMSVDDNDYYCCFSGPPNDITNICKLDQKGNLIIDIRKKIEY